MAANPLLEGIEALRRQEPKRAISALDAAIDSPLDGALLARAYSLRAQAKLQCADLAGAMVDWREAWRRVLDLEDREGELALKGLRTQIAQARAQKNATHAQKSRSRQSLEEDLEAALKSASNAEERLNILLEHANAHMDCAQPYKGLALAEQALTEANAEDPPVVRVQVLARLCVLRAKPEQGAELLEEAYTLADEANEPQLIGAIARAAKSIGYEFSAIEI